MYMKFQCLKKLIYITEIVNAHYFGVHIHYFGSDLLFTIQNSDFFTTLHLESTHQIR